MSLANDAWPSGSCLVQNVKDELRGLCLGDARRNSRGICTALGMARRPSESLPNSIGKGAELEGAYDFFSNKRVTFEKLLHGHALATAERMAAEREVLVVHDTTEFAFSTDREGLGRLSSKSSGRRGFMLHASLAVTADGRRLPLGVIWAHTYVRSDEPKPTRRNGKECAASTDREADRWCSRPDETESMLAGRGVSQIHIADREADSYRVLWVLAGRRFVIRASHDRCVLDVDEEPTRLSELSVMSQRLVEVEVPVSKRAPSKQPNAAKAHPAHPARIARVMVSSARATLRRPNNVTEVDDTLDVNVVYVREIEAPAGCEPICWVLHTSEPVDERDQVLRIIEFYRARWIIEEFFKALKTGCTFEELQLESYHALANALALYIPIAYLMLSLRTLARVEPKAPASRVLSKVQIEILRTQEKKLPTNPTAHEALIAVAGMGGFLRQNKKKGPGWLVLSRGVRELLALEKGWRLRDRSDLVNL